MNKKYYDLFVDMDEVIVDLTSYIISQYNRDFNDNMKVKDNQSYWWSDCKKADKSYFEQLLLEQGTFYFPKPVDRAIETLTKLYNEGFNIHIITMPQWNSDYCVQEKIQWIQAYLPFVDVSKNVHFTGNKGLLAKENRILIDDNVGHLQSWRSQNGTAIAFGNFGWSKEWQRLRCINWNEVYDMIHKIK